MANNNDNVIDLTVIHPETIHPETIHPTVPLTASNLILLVYDLYVFMGAEEHTIKTTYFCNSAIITATLILSPNPQVCVDF